MAENSNENSKKLKRTIKSITDASDKLRSKVQKAADAAGDYGKELDKVNQKLNRQKKAAKAYQTVEEKGRKTTAKEQKKAAANAKADINAIFKTISEQAEEALDETLDKTDDFRKAIEDQLDSTTAYSKKQIMKSSVDLLDDLEDELESFASDYGDLLTSENESIYRSLTSLISNAKSSVDSLDRSTDTLFKDIDEGFTSFKEKFSAFKDSLLDWANALNLNDIANKIGDSSNTFVETERNIQRALNLNQSQLSEYEDLIYEVARDTGNKRSATEVQETVSVLTGIGMSEFDTIKEYLPALEKAATALNIDPQSLANIATLAWKENSPELISQMAAQLQGVRDNTNYDFMYDSLLENSSELLDSIRILAKDSEAASRDQQGLIAGQAFMESNFLGELSSSILNDISSAGTSYEEWAGVIEKYAAGGAISMDYLNEIRKAINEGDMRAAYAALVKSFATMDVNVATQIGSLEAADLSNIRLFQDNIQTEGDLAEALNGLDVAFGAGDTASQNSEQVLTNAIDNAAFSLSDQMSNTFENSEIGQAITRMSSMFDVSLSDVFIAIAGINQFKELFGNTALGKAIAGALKGKLSNIPGIGDLFSGSNIVGDAARSTEAAARAVDSASKATDASSKFTSTFFNNFKTSTKSFFNGISEKISSSFITKNNLKPKIPSLNKYNRNNDKAIADFFNQNRKFSTNNLYKDFSKSSKYLINDTSKVGEAFTKVGGKFSSAAKMLGKIAAPLTVAFDAFGGLDKAEQWLGEKNLKNTITTTLSSAIAGSERGVTGAIGNAFKGAAIGTMIAPGIGTAVGAAIGGILGAVGGESLSKFFDAVPGYLEESWEVFKKDGLFGVLGKWWDDATKGIGDWWNNTMIPDLENVFRDFWPGLHEKIDGFVVESGRFVGEFWQGILRTGDDINDALGGIPGIIIDAGGNLATRLGEIVSGINDWFWNTPVGQAIKGGLDALGQWTTETFGLEENYENLDAITGIPNYAATVGIEVDPNMQGPQQLVLSGKDIGLSDKQGKEAMSGSYAGGLSEVPVDGLLAILHQGEAVLTKSQAGLLRNLPADGGIDISSMLSNSDGQIDLFTDIDTKLGLANEYKLTSIDASIDFYNTNLSILKDMQSVSRSTLKGITSIAASSASTAQTSYASAINAANSLMNSMTPTVIVADENTDVNGLLDQLNQPQNLEDSNYINPDQIDANIANSTPSSIIEETNQTLNNTNGQIGSYAVGTPWVNQDQLAIIHKGEAVVPADFNPYNPANMRSVSTEDTGTNNADIINVLRWGFNKLDARLSTVEDKLQNQSGSNTYNYNDQYIKQPSATDVVFSF